MTPAINSIFMDRAKACEVNEMPDVIDRIAATLDTHAADRAIEFAGSWINWGDVKRYGDQVTALLDSAGCPPAEKIGIVIRNRPAYAAAIVGLLVHRRSISFIYAFSPPRVLAEQIKSLNAAAIIADDADWLRIHDAVAECGTAGITLGSAYGAAHDAPRFEAGLEQMRRPHGPPATSHAAPEAAIEVLSSGTTGTPKRINMPLQMLERAVQSAPGGESGVEPPIQINIWPFGGVGGTCLLAASAAIGIPMVLMERFTVAEFASALRRHRPPMLGLSPTAISMIMDADVPAEDFASVIMVSGGSAHLDPDLQDRFEEKYNLPVYWAMGATEFCGTIIRWTPQMREKVGNSKRGSIGLPMPGVEIRVVDPETGEILGAGQDGLLEVYCPAVRPDWVRTTDLMMIDADGYAFHRGRHDGAITRGGFEIMPEQIIKVLRAHPAVADASVIGLADKRLGAVPVAAVELLSQAPPTTPDQLIDYLRANLPSTHVPAELRIVEALPRTASLKVSLADMRLLFEAPAEPGQAAEGRP
jgi:long-chain acyl-CoA synthetase